MDKDRLYEQSASRWLEMLDNEGRTPKIARVIEAVCEAHPSYDMETVAYCLQAKEFDAYLKDRRKRHLIERTAARLVAAEMGAQLGVGALERLQERLDEMSDKDLISVAKLGMELNAGIDRDLTEVTGDAKITINLKNILVGLPPERAAVLMGEYGRAMASPKAKGGVIDADCTEE
jgi:hypothetical protein